MNPLGMVGYFLVFFAFGLSSPCQLRTFSCRCKTGERVTVEKCVPRAWPSQESTESVCQSEKALSLCNQGTQPLVTSFGLQGSNVAAIGSDLELICVMLNAESSIFFKSDTSIRENSRYTYTHHDSLGPNGKILISRLEITNITKEDEGIYTCYAFKAGIVASKSFTFNTGGKISSPSSVEAKIARKLALV